jgi:anti-sigma factor RsiW
MSRQIEDWELSAYVDGELPSHRMEEVRAAAELDARLRRRLDQLLADHHALGELGDSEQFQPREIPPRLARYGADLANALRASDRRPASSQLLPAPLTVWRQVAGLAAAAALGWGAASWAAQQDDALSSFIDEAAEVHRVASVAPTFSREASASVIESLTRLFAHKLTPPDLSSEGFSLDRVDVAATDTGPAAVFYYTDPEARRLSLILSLDTPTIDSLDDGAAPRVTTHDGLAVSFGRHRDVAYALVGSLPEPNVRLLASRAAATLNN